MIDFRLLRGGSWDYIPMLCRSAYRCSLHFVIHGDDVGFRVCCSSEGNGHTLRLEEQADG